MYYGSGTVLRIASGQLAHMQHRVDAVGARQTPHMHSLDQRCLNLWGNDAFCVTGNAGERAERCYHRVRFETRRCVKMRLQLGLGPGPHWGNLEHSPRPSIARFAGGK